MFLNARRALAMALLCATCQLMPTDGILASPSERVPVNFGSVVHKDFDVSEGILYVVWPRRADAWCQGLESLERAGDCVLQFEIKLGEDRFWVTKNYLEVPPHLADGEIKLLSVRAWLRSGVTTGWSSAVTLSDADYVVAPTLLDDFSEVEDSAPSKSGSLWRGPKVRTPVYGPYELIGPAATSNETQREWGYWQHEDTTYHQGPHKYCLDINLNVRGSYFDMDDLVPFYSTSRGKVRRVTDDGNGGFTEVEVRLNWGGRKHFFEYQHGQDLTVSEGDRVTYLMQLGLISNGGADNNHLHYCQYYEPEEGDPGFGETDGLGRTSFPPRFRRSGVRLDVAELRIPQGMMLDVNQVPIRVFGWRGSPNTRVYLGNLSDALGNQTFWRTNNQSVAGVDGDGSIVGREEGDAVIRVDYLGKRHRIEVQVADIGEDEVVVLAPLAGRQVRRGEDLVVRWIADSSIGTKVRLRVFREDGTYFGFLTPTTDRTTNDGHYETEVLLPPGSYRVRVGALSGPGLWGWSGGFTVLD